MKLEDHERLALGHLVAFYQILGQRRELWESGAEYIHQSDLRYPAQCYWLGVAHGHAESAMWHLKQAQGTFCFTMQVEWRRNEEPGEVIVNDHQWEMQEQ